VTLHGMLAISFAAGVPAEQRQRLIRSGSSGLSTVNGHPTKIADIGADDSLVVILAGTSTGGVGLSLVAGPCPVEPTTNSFLATANSVREGDLAVLGNFVPPFAACFPGSKIAEIVVATDSCGLRHIFRTEATGWSAVSTSSLTLAAMNNGGLDVEAIGHYALVGAYHGTATPYTGVSRVPAGAAVRLFSGTARITTYPNEPVTVAGGRDIPSLVRAGAQAVTGAVDSALASYPDAALELSGGLDSRMVLAGIPAHLRAGRRAFTLGLPESADWEIATEIARAQGLDHCLIDVSELPAQDPESAAALVRSAALRRDCSGNALAFAALDWVEERIGPGVRLSGQNGEFARGFYYAGQPDFSAPNKWLIDALGRWRIMTNDSVDGAIFAAGVAEEQKRLTLARLRGAIGSYDGSWLAATDEYYLRERMVGWLGAEWSASCLDRTVLAPFFHPGYISWARACAPRYKRGARIFSAVLQRLDPQLAALPSTAGFSPAEIAHREGNAALSRRARHTADKVVAKVRQRLRHDGKPAMGASALAGGITQLWADKPAVLEPVARLPFLDADVIAAIATGGRPAGPSTIALLVDLMTMLDVVNP
jgi:asparagine synthase (glutamine-hydrolysing)